MPRRHILTERQRKTLLDIPTDEASLLRHYTLADDDLEYIQTRRRAHNRFGFALQLCALRFPGRLLGRTPSSQASTDGSPKNFLSVGSCPLPKATPRCPVRVSSCRVPGASRHHPGRPSACWPLPFR